MNTAKKICESDEQGVVHVEVPIGRPGQRVEVLVVWDETWTEEELREFQAELAAQRMVDRKLWE